MANKLYLICPELPEQNPVEDIWLQGKNLLRKFAYRCKSFAIVKRLFMFLLNRQILGFSKLYMVSFHNSIRIAIAHKLLEQPSQKPGYFAANLCDILVQLQEMY
jgi:hypothetical protein